MAPIFRFALNKLRRAALALGLLVAVVAVGCSTGTYPFDFFYEMHYQQSYQSHEPPRLSPPVDAVPITGKELVLDLTFDEADKLTNPLIQGGVRLGVDEGERLFAINCTMCHGTEGQGDGAVLLTMMDRDRYGYVPKLPPDLMAVTFSDGVIFAIISDRDTVFPGIEDWVMPQFRRLLTSEERWMLVNYIHSLQGQ